MEGHYFKIIISVILVISLLVAKKMGGKKKLGCIGFGYVSLVVFLISIFAVMITSFLTRSAINGVQTYMEGEEYMATIVSYSSHESTDDDGRRTTMYTPTYEIKISADEIYQVQDYISSGDVPLVGHTVKLYYNKATGKMLQFSAGTAIMAIGMFIMWFVMSCLFAGILVYLSNGDISKYFKAMQTIGMGFFILFLMIAFEVLLIYALFYGNPAPVWVYGLLVVFIIGLGLGTLGYLKMLFSKGLPKWKRTSDLSWSADWDEDDECQ